MTDHAEPASIGSLPLRYCGISEQMLEEARRRELAWNNKRRLKLYMGDRLPGIPPLGPIAMEVVAPVQRVCGLVFSLTTVLEEADLITLTMPARRSDGPGGVLAEHEMPPGDDRPLRGWYDTRETWTTAYPPSQRIYLIAVMRHEILHGLGLPHAGNGIRTLMAPYYDPSIVDLGAWEIEELTRRYGPPVEEPKPVDPGQPPVPGGAPAELQVVIACLGATYAGALPKKLG